MNVVGTSAMPLTCRRMLLDVAAWMRLICDLWCLKIFTSLVFCNDSIKAFAS